jgi:glycogen phosphorylase
MIEVSTQPMQQAVQTKIAEEFRDSFAAIENLPKKLEALDRLSLNFFWSWHPEGVALFRDLEPELWEKSEQNPRLLLKSVRELRLWQMAADDDYVARLRAFTTRFDDYIAQSNDEASLAYFCAEYGVHNSLPNYSGGLGILAGDHLKSASDLNLPLVAVGLLYRYGYFRQSISHDGWQEERYYDVFQSELALTPVLDANGERVKIMVHIRGREVYAQAWLAKIGRISLHLLDANIEENTNEVDRLITGHLYGGSTETRIVQEKVLGIGGVRLLRKLGIEPTVFHLNEGHSAFLTLELAREYLTKHPEASFEEARAAAASQCVFTTHTPVSAGNDAFSVEELRNCFDANFISSLKLTADEFFDLGRVDPNNDSEPFGMTPLALRMSRSANGVSEKHGEVSRELWVSMFSNDNDTNDVPITHVTNGVHPPTWIADTFQKLFERSIGSDWQSKVADTAAWSEAVGRISDREIWEAHLLLKNMLIGFIRERTAVQDIGSHDTIHEHIDTRKLLDPTVLTIGFARRVAAYKRWNLLLTDLDRLLRLVDNPERPVQFVFAGKAHPQDRTAKQILQQLMRINNDSNWQHRAVFIEDYDQEVARYLVHGVDVWMNVPRRPLEASGTSGMKAAMNGILNFSILDGWWIEGYNGENGFEIGSLSEDENDETADREDAESLYSTLENQLVPTFYEKDESDLPARWIRRMRNSIATLTPMFSSDRMVREYLERIYKAEH